MIKGENMSNNPAIENLCKPKEWTVMVYLTGGRDISDEARESLLRMKQVGSTGKIHLVAQFDSGSEGTFTKRYYLTEYKNSLEILTLLHQTCSEVLEAYGPDDEDAVCMDCYQRLWRLLDEKQQQLLEKMPPEEMKKMIVSTPDRFMNSVLNWILDDDVYPHSSGSLGDTNAGDPGVLVDFVRWAKVRYPAEHYLVVLWGHGSGLSVAWVYPIWPSIRPGDPLTAHELLEAFEMATSDLRDKFIAGIKEFIREQINEKNSDVIAKMGFPESGVNPNESIDSLIESFLENEIGMPGVYGTATQIDPVKHAYKSKVDIVGFNSCSLATIEVYRQLSGLVDYVVASEGFTPKTSWPYDRILKTLDDQSEKLDEANQIFAEVSNQHTEANKKWTQNPDNEELKKKVDELWKKMTEIKEKISELALVKSGKAEGLAKIIVTEHIEYYKELIKAAENLKELQRKAKELEIDMDVVYGYDLRIKGIGMRGKGIGMRGKGIGMRGKGIGMRGKGIGMDSEEGLLEISGIDLCVCRPEKSEKVAKCMKILAAKLTNLLNKESVQKKVLGAIQGAHSASQSYFMGNFSDLHDFCRALSIFDPECEIDEDISCDDIDGIDLQDPVDANNPLQSSEADAPKLENISISSICDCVMKAVDEMIIKKDNTGEDVRNSNGASIFFPWGEWAETDATNAYEELELKFLEETNWQEPLRKYRELAANFEAKKDPF
jgi:hypothetical protein